MSVNAGEATARLTEAVVDGLSISVNAGSADVSLPASPFGGSASVNAGSLSLCVPEGTAMRVTLELGARLRRCRTGLQPRRRRLGDERLDERRQGLGVELEREPRIG